MKWEREKEEDALAREEVARQFTTLDKNRKEFAKRKKDPNSKCWAGKQRMKLDWQIVRAMCRNLNRQDEIAGALGISTCWLRYLVEDEIGLKWVEFYNLHSMPTLQKARQAQLKKAIEDEDVQMLKWIGENYLGQGSRQKIEANVSTVELTDEDIQKIDRNVEDEF